MSHQQPQQQPQETDPSCNEPSSQSDAVTSLAGDASASAASDASSSTATSSLETSAAAAAAASTSGGLPKEIGNFNLQLDQIPEPLRSQIIAQIKAQQKTSLPPEEQEHKFWDTQPVPKLKEKVEANGAIEATKKVADVTQSPLPLPSAFEWVNMDVVDKIDVDDLHHLLLENYVEDDDAMFRFAYKPAFLQWALQPPGWRRDWHVGVRVKASRKLVAFISAIPVDLTVETETVRAVEINFLCVHKKLRSKRLAPVLIAEITRRVNLQDIWFAVYTAGILLPKPVARCQYYHRSLNPRKLIAVEFASVPSSLRSFKDPIAATERLFALPSEPRTPGLRPMEERDVPVAHALLREYLHQGHHLRTEWSVEEFRHWMLPRKGVVHSYVVESPETREVTDFFSYYALPSSVIKHEEYKTLNAAYLFYSVAKTVSLEHLLRDALISAKNDGFDVMNALDMMGNAALFDELHFGAGDGFLHYYLFNYRAREIARKDVGLIML